MSLRHGNGRAVVAGNRRHRDHEFGLVTVFAEIAELAAFLLGPQGSFIQGSVYYIDGGSDAEMRPDRF